MWEWIQIVAGSISPLRKGLGATTARCEVGDASPATLEAVDKLLKQLRKQGHTQLRFVYEAGPCSYGIYRLLHGREGIACAVVAPSKIPRQPGERVKTNRRDALKLARLDRAGELEAIYVPNPRISA